MDILLRNETIRDDQLAAALGMALKDLQKICGRLKQQGLVQVESRLEEIPMAAGVKETGEKRERRKVGRCYYYIDYPKTVNVIKWKVFKVQGTIDSKVTKKSTQIPYKCIGCGKVYSALDMLSLQFSEDLIPLCDIDGAELEVDKTSNTTSTNTQYIQFMHETKPILDLLKETDRLIIPESEAKLPSLLPEEEKIAVVEPVTIVAASNKILIEITEDKTEELHDDLSEYYKNLAQVAQITPMYISFNVGKGNWNSLMRKKTLKKCNIFKLTKKL